MKIEWPLVLDFTYNVGVISTNERLKTNVGFFFMGCFKLFLSSCWWGNDKVKNTSWKNCIGYSLKKKVWIWKPLRVGFHCSCNFLVESIKEDSNALCLQVMDETGLIWGFYNIVRVENTPREQCRVKFQVSSFKQVWYQIVQKKYLKS